MKADGFRMAKVARPFLAANEVGWGEAIVGLYLSSFWKNGYGIPYTTVGKVSTDRQSKKFSSTDDRFLWTVGVCALNSLSAAGAEKDPISTEILD